MYSQLIVTAVLRDLNYDAFLLFAGNISEISSLCSQKSVTRMNDFLVLDMTSLPRVSVLVFQNEN